MSNAHLLILEEFLKFFAYKSWQHVGEDINIVYKQICASLDQHFHFVFPKQDAKQDKIGFAEVIRLKRDRAIRVFFSKPLDSFQTDDPHVKRVTPRELVYDQFERIDVLPLMLYEVEHGLHFFELLFFHNLKFDSALSQQLILLSVELRYCWTCLPIRFPRLFKWAFSSSAILNKMALTVEFSHLSAYRIYRSMACASSIMAKFSTAADELNSG